MSFTKKIETTRLFTTGKCFDPHKFSTVEEHLDWKKNKKYANTIFLLKKCMLLRNFEILKFLFQLWLNAEATLFEDTTALTVYRFQKKSTFLRKTTGI